MFQSVPLGQIELYSIRVAPVDQGLNCILQVRIVLGPPQAFLCVLYTAWSVFCETEVYRSNSIFAAQIISIKRQGVLNT